MQIGRLQQFSASSRRAGSGAGPQQWHVAQPVHCDGNCRKTGPIKTADYLTERAKQGDPEAALTLLSRKGAEAPQAGDEIIK